jgi:hypothetical protein
VYIFCRPADKPHGRYAHIFLEAHTHDAYKHCNTARETDKQDAIMQNATTLLFLAAAILAGSLSPAEASFRHSPTPSILFGRFSSACAAKRLPAGTDSALRTEKFPPLPVVAAGSVRGVGTLGYGSSARPAPPPPAYGGTPGDYARGYEGLSPAHGDPWHRESDFKARDYLMRHGPQPDLAAPPRGSAPPLPAESRFPTLPKPPLPGDRDMPSDSPDVAAPSGAIRERR